MSLAGRAVTAPQPPHYHALWPEGVSPAVFCPFAVPILADRNGHNANFMKNPKYTHMAS